MANFLRQKYKEKPAAWGSVDSVQRSLFKNAERIGIDSDDIALAMPMWNPGNQIDYISKTTGTLNGTATFKNNSIETGYILMPDIKKELFLSQFTVFMSATILSTGSSDSAFANNSKQNTGFACTFSEYPSTTKYGVSLNGVVNQSSTLSRTTLKKNNIAWLVKFGDSFRIYESLKTATMACGSPLNTWLTNGVTIGGAFKNSEIRDTSNAIYYQCLAFKNILKDSQISLLSDNPYQLWQRQPDVFFSIPASVTVDNLTSTNIITANPVISTSDITQSHILTSNDITASSTAISQPDISQLNVLLSDSIISASPGISQPTLSESTHILTANNIETQSTVISQSIISQTHILTSNDITSTPGISQPSLSAVENLDILTATDIVSTPTISISTSAISQTHILTSNDITAIPSIQEPVIGQICVLSSTNIITASTVITEPVIQLLCNLTALNITTIPIITDAVISQIHLLTTSNLTANPPTIASPFLNYSAPITPVSRIIIIEAESRQITIEYESRNVNIESETRTIII